MRGKYPLLECLKFKYIITFNVKNFKFPMIFFCFCVFYVSLELFIQLLLRVTNISSKLSFSKS